MAIAQNNLHPGIEKSASISKEFFYKDKPISPMALIDLFPISEGGSNASKIDLGRYPFINEIKLLDTISYNWRNEYQRQRSYILLMKFDSVSNEYHNDHMDTVWIPSFVNYTVIDTTPGGKFVVMTDFYPNDEQRKPIPVPPTYLFILDVKGHYLIKLWEAKENYDDQGFPVKIKGNILVNGRSEYKIPDSAL